MALTKGRIAAPKDGGPGLEYESYPVLTNVKIYNGSIVVLDVATGYARQAIAGAPGTYIGLGVAEGQDFGGIPGIACDNTGGASGAKYVRVRRGVFPMKNSGTAPVDNTMIGSAVFAEDDYTVSATNQSSTLSQIGHVWKVDTGTGPGQNHGAVVWVGIGVGFGTGPTGAAGAVGHASNAGGTLSFTAGDIALTAGQIVDGTVFKVPTTATNSTITLPTASMPATPAIVYFVADGSANGHTVTYRVGTTALTAAATASKVHLSIAVWSGTGWSDSLSVSP